MHGEIIELRLRGAIAAAERGRKCRAGARESASNVRDLVGEDVAFIVDARRPRQIIATSASLWTAFGDIRDCIANDR
jgi:hypothetical protein